MTGNMILAMAAFGAASSLVFLVYLLTAPRSLEIDVRLADASRPSAEGKNPFASAAEALSNLGSKLMPEKETKLESAKARLLQAGFYRGRASAMFFAMRFLLLVLPVLVGLLLSFGDMISLTDGILYGAIVGAVGTLAPGIWVDRLKAGRQRQVRRALPDTLDVLVICLEGGLSLPASFARVSDELGTAYPLLAAEMNIVRKQIELGQSMAAAFRDFSDRFGIDELRSLSLLIGQAEKFGASLVRTMRIEADSLRVKRYQWAEAQAQKAPLKLIFPTVLCIFPALYIVLMGPAFLEIYKMLQGMGS
jgi:tight adherence protein C